MEVACLARGQERESRSVLSHSLFRLTVTRKLLPTILRPTTRRRLTPKPRMIHEHPVELSRWINKPLSTRMYVISKWPYSLRVSDFVASDFRAKFSRPMPADLGRQYQGNLAPPNGAETAGRYNVPSLPIHPRREKRLMKLKKALLRWYKSFHLNYRGQTEKGETTSYRPWDDLSPEFAKGEKFPFIEIPIENDITTIVGANESGKSHLLNAITKAFRGTATDNSDKFKRTDLCHFAGIRTRNVEACPNLGLQFAFESDPERRAIGELLAGEGESATHSDAPTFTFIIEPLDEQAAKAKAYLYIEPNPQAFPLSAKQLEKLRSLLPSVEFIDSRALLASEIPLAQLIAACGDPTFASIGLLDRRSVEQAAQQINALAPPPAQQAAPTDFAGVLDGIKSAIKNISGPAPGKDSLEMRLFKEILDIKPDTLKYIYNLPMSDRGYIEGQIAKWNDEINDKLNLAHFWRQDEQFSLAVNFKDGVIYFEIRDKTDSIYTFKERSSGLKFFLSYYIQAKAMEVTHRNRNSIILMDEPDSALSILGQRNLLSVFESLVSPESSKQTCQLIYTTHSPYLINRNFPRRIRVVKKEDAEEGTQYIEQARARRYEPVRTALGIDSAPSLFLGADNILLEGPTDQFLFTEMIRVFATPQNVGEFLDLNAVVVVSADGVGNVRNVLEQSHWADEPIPPTAVVVDSDPPAIDVVDTITSAVGGKKAVISREFVSTLGELVSPFGANKVIVTSEDIVPVAIYKAAIQGYIERWLRDTLKTHAVGIQNDLSDENFGKDGLVESTKAFFKKYKPEFNGDYDKMGIFQKVVEIAGIRLADFQSKKINDPEFVLDPDTHQLKVNIIALCDFIREALAKSRAVSAKFSTTQAIKRIIYDFKRLNKLNVPITALQKLFRRLEREVAPIGNDGDALLHLINTYLSELETLRAAGQERIVDDQWTDWASRIESIKKNPLAIPASAGTAPSLPRPRAIKTSTVSSSPGKTHTTTEKPNALAEQTAVDQVVETNGES